MKNFKEFLSESLNFKNTTYLNPVKFRDLMNNMKSNGWKETNTKNKKIMKHGDIVIEIDLPSGWDDYNDMTKKLFHYRSNEIIHL